MLRQTCIVMFLRLKEEGKMILFSQCKRFFICVSTQNNGEFLEIICVYQESLYKVTEDVIIMSMRYHL